MEKVLELELFLFKKSFLETLFSDVRLGISLQDLTVTFQVFCSQQKRKVSLFQNYLRTHFSPEGNLGQWSIVCITGFSLDVRTWHLQPNGHLFFVLHSGGGGNFVLSTSLVGYLRVQGVVVPMVHNGYGFFYHIRDDR